MGGQTLRKVSPDARCSIGVTRLGEISPVGRVFLYLGAFFSEKYRPKDLVVDPGLCKFFAFGEIIIQTYLNDD
jgi:hypothetical protein